MRVRPQQQSTIPVAMAAMPKVMSTGPSTGADGSVVAMRSTSDEARIPVIAAVELSGPPIANGIELRNASTAPIIAEVTKVVATP